MDTLLECDDWSEDDMSVPRSFGVIPTTIWQRDRRKVEACIRSRSPDAQEDRIALETGQAIQLLTYLWSSPTATSIGLYYLSFGQLTEEACLSRDAALEALEHLEAAGLAYYDRETSTAYVPGMAIEGLCRTTGKLRDKKKLAMVDSLASEMFRLESPWVYMWVQAHKDALQLGFWDDFFAQHMPPEGASSKHLRCCFEAASEQLRSTHSPSPSPSPSPSLRIPEGARAPARPEEAEAASRDKPSAPQAADQEAGGKVLEMDPVVHEVECKGGKPFRLRKSQIEKWREAYPALDVDTAIRDAVEWHRCAPASRKKTPRGMPAFFNNWLRRTRDSPGSGKSPPSSKAAWGTVTRPPSKRNF